MGDRRPLSEASSQVREAVGIRQPPAPRLRPGASVLERLEDELRAHIRQCEQEEGEPPRSG